MSSQTTFFTLFPECVARVPVSLWGSGGWGCVRSTLCNRSQPFAAVRNRSREGPTYPRAISISIYLFIYSSIYLSIYIYIYIRSCLKRRSHLLQWPSLQPGPCAFLSASSDTITTTNHLGSSAAQPWNIKRTTSSFSCDNNCETFWATFQPHAIALICCRMRGSGPSASCSNSNQCHIKLE